jgi:hypothetical protein
MSRSGYAAPFVVGISASVSGRCRQLAGVVLVFKRLLSLMRHMVHPLALPTRLNCAIGTL